MKPSRYFLSFILILTLFLQPPSQVFARQVQLDVNLGNPVVQAGIIQKTFLKISLKGYDVPLNEDRSPLNVAVVLDKSGSMKGEKLRRAKEAAIRAIEMLHSRDIVSVISYDSVVQVIVPATKLTDIYEITKKIRRIPADGSTALFAGVSKGAHEVRKFLSRNKINRVILLSDGQANIGPSSPQELGQLGSSLGREGISVTTIGLGLGYNEDLMTRLAGYSDGNHYFAQYAGDLEDIFRKEFDSALSVVAKELIVIIHCADGIRPLRLLGREGEILGRTVRVPLNQLSGGQEKFVILEVEVPPGHEGQKTNLASVDVSYRDLKSKREDSLNDSVFIEYTKSANKVEKFKDQRVMESAVEQTANEMSKDALRYMDSGNLSKAKEVLDESARFLKKNAQTLQSPALREMEQEMRQDVMELDDSNVNQKRKSMKARQFKRERQQMY